MDGIQDLEKENLQIRLSIVNTAKPMEIRQGTLAHDGIGMNFDPLSKIQAFTKLMDTGLGNSVDLAFFKFCFVDFGPNTDVDKVFADYKKTLAGVQERYSKTRLIHMTVPLMEKQTGPKSWIKKLIGKPLSGYEDNIRINRFNDLLRAEYGKQGALFDLAGLESTHRDGGRSTFVKDGKTYYSLASEYTNDGGHLNEKGRKVVAEQLLILLATLSR